MVACPGHSGPMYKPDIQLVDRNVIVPSLHTLHNWQISFMNIPSTSCSSRSWVKNVFYGLEHDLHGAIFSRKKKADSMLIFTEEEN